MEGHKKNQSFGAKALAHYESANLRIVDSGNFVCIQKRYLKLFCWGRGDEQFILLFRGLCPEAGNAGSRGDLSHILLEVLELQLRSAHVRPPKPSPKA